MLGFYFLIVPPDILKPCCVLIPWEVGRGPFLIQNAELGKCLSGLGSVARLQGGHSPQAEDAGRLWWATLESLSSSITSWFLLMKTCRQNTNAFQENRSGFCCLFPPSSALWSLLRVPQWSPCNTYDLFSHFTKTYVLWQADVDSSFPKDEKHVTENISQTQGKALWVLHNHKERKSRSHLEPVLFVKENEDEEEVSDDLVLSQLLKTKQWCQRPLGSDTTATCLSFPQGGRKHVQTGFREMCEPQGMDGANGCIPCVCLREIHWQLPFGWEDSVWGTCLGLRDSSCVILVSGNPGGTRYF